MRSLLNLLVEGKAYPLLSLYILCTLSTGPKTGYEIIKEIRRKTGGVWNPSKGTIYPLLYKLEEGGLVKREGDTYMVTDKGMETLREAREQRANANRKLRALRKLALEVFYPDEEYRRMRMAILERIDRILDLLEKNPEKGRLLIEQLDEILTQHGG